MLKNVDKIRSSSAKISQELNKTTTGLSFFYSATSLHFRRFIIVYPYCIKLFVINRSTPFKYSTNVKKPRQPFIYCRKLNRTDSLRLLEVFYAFLPPSPGKANPGTIKHMFERLQKKWKVNGWQLAPIIATFAIGGSVTGFLGKKIMNALAIGQDWLWTLIYILLITLIWPLAVIIISIPMGQFRFFRRYLRKIGSRMGIGKKQP
jgi:hypothetical protein